MFDHYLHVFKINSKTDSIPKCIRIDESILESEEFYRQSLLEILNFVNENYKDPPQQTNILPELNRINFEIISLSKYLANQYD